MKKDILNTDFKDRKVDKVPVQKSKEYLWKHIQRKTGLEESPQKKTGTSFVSFMASLFKPKKVAWASVIAVLTIAAITFGPNLQNLIQGGMISGPPTVHASFTMTADNQDAAGIAEDSSFTLEASEDLDASIVEENIISTPKVDLNVTKTEPGKYKVEAAEPLEPNAVYNFKIVSQTDEGPKEYSWSYQVKDTFKIYGTLPGNETNGVPTNSGIEINFSHENYDFENMSKYFSISPAVEGSFEKHRRTVSFIPKGGLQPETVYTVTVKSGLKLLESDKELEEDYKFQFETALGESGPRRHLTFTRQYYEVGTNQDLALTVYLDNKILEDPEVNTTTNVNIYQFKDLDQYLEAIKAQGEIPSWSYYAKRNQKYDLENMMYVGEFDGEMKQGDSQKYLHVPSANLGAGYYVFQTSYNNYHSQALVQITDLAAYITITRSGSIAWVNDITTGQPVKGAKLELLDENISADTNNQGLAEFKVPTQESGNHLIKISSGNKLLITEVYTGKTSQAYWNFLTSDRPKFKPSDTIKYWGFVDPKETNANTLDLSMKLEKGWGFFDGFYTDTFVEDLPFEMETDTTFRGELKIENMLPGYYVLNVYDGETRISSNSIQIQPYTKPAYNVEITTDKKAVFAGESVNVDIDTNFFDGTPVPYMALDYSADGNKQSLETDENGEVSTTYTTEYRPCIITSYSCYNTHNQYINVSPALGEESTISDSQRVQIFNSKLNLDMKGENTDNVANLTFQTNWIDLSRINSETEKRYDDYLGDAAGGREISGQITEYWWDQIENGEYYDFVSKTVKTRYKSERRERPFGTFDLETDANGEAAYSFTMDPEKYYIIKALSPDNEGKESYDSVTVYGRSSEQYNSYYKLEVGNYIDDEHQTFDIGDTINAVIYKGKMPLKTDKGSFLFMQYNNGLQEYLIKNEPTYNFEFANDDIPTVYVQGVWFDGQEYHATFTESLDYNKELKSLNVEVSPTKDSYEPGDKVTLEVLVTDANGRPVATEVNMNLVDEAYFKVVYDNITDPLDFLYSGDGSGIVSTYRTHVNPATETMDTGGKGGCFTAGTKILMADGTYKPIEEIANGDYILTKENPFSSALIKGEVVNTVSHYVDEYLVLNETLKVTGEHVVFVNGMWDTADTVKLGDTLLDSNENSIKVTSIRQVREPIWVYNFEVKDFHTYFAEDLYVHNDKGGDGVRNDFEDTALFETVSTNSSGKGTVTFQLPDNITSWRIVASAIDTKDIQAGVGIGSVKVTLPLFANLVMNKEFSIKDSPTIKLRTFGTGIEKGDDINYTVKAKSLGVDKSETMVEPAFDAAYYDLPDLTMGEHDIQLDVSAGKYSDALSLPIEVTGSRLKKSVSALIPSVTESTQFELPKDSYAEVFFMDAGLADHFSNMYGLYHSRGDRLDQRLSEVIAADLLKDNFEQDLMVKRDFDVTRYQHSTGGLSLLPYADPDLKLSAMVTYVETDLDRYNRQALTEYFLNIYSDPESNLEEVVLSLLGLASLDEPVLTSLNAIKDDPELDLHERLYVALAYQSIGSNQDAKDIYDEISDQLMKDNDYESALGMMLAAGLQEKDDAITLKTYVQKHGIENDIANLYRLGYSKHGLKYANPSPASLTVRPGNSEEKIELNGFGTHSVIASGFKGLSVTDVEGDIGAVVYYEETVEPSAFKNQESLSITRQYFNVTKDEYTNEFGEGDLVRINLSLEGEADTPYRITDIMPSGFKLASAAKYYDPRYSAMSPYDTFNQEVYFYWNNSEYDKKYRSYYAQVVSPGTYYADPAKIESYLDEDRASISDSATITINQYAK